MPVKCRHVYFCYETWRGARGAPQRRQAGCTPGAGAGGRSHVVLDRPTISKTHRRVDRRLQRHTDVAEDVGRRPAAGMAQLGHLPPAATSVWVCWGGRRSLNDFLDDVRLAPALTPGTTQGAHAHMHTQSLLFPHGAARHTSQARTILRLPFFVPPLGGTQPNI